MQARAPMDEDMEGLTGYRGWRRSSDGPSRRTLTARLIAEAAGGVCLLALLCWVIALSVQLRSLQKGNISIASECLHALGGGPVAAGGSLHPATAEQCRAQLRSYAQGPYWQEVELAAADAMQTFGFAAPAGPSSSSSNSLSKLSAALLQRVSRSLLAFAGGSSDTSSSSSSKRAASSGRLGGPRHCGAAHDQPGQGAVTGGAAATAALQMAANHQQQQQQQQGEPRPLVVFDIDETLLSNMPQILDPETWTWEAWVAAAQAQPLQPMAAFYDALCRHGYAIALVTGRREASRNSTMANLQRAGYGAPCSSQGGSSSSDSAEAACCYDALLMRAADDTRLASVYKPWARAQLLAGGSYSLAALLGDQFSDINGLGIEAGSGVQAYKLPNPFYFIL